jgi:hypothetical protein
MSTTIGRLTVLMFAVMLYAGAVRAQTPEQQRQMEYERQQREYWRAQEQQRQEQQRQQQIMNDNARRQQEESARASRSAMPQSPGAMAPPAGGRAMGSGVPGGAAGANLERARQDWLKRPALAAASNPLLGTWTRPATRANPNDSFAQLGALMKGGLCEVFFSGDAVFEFRPGALVGIDKRTHRVEPLDQVEYRGGAKQVVVIPKATLKLIVFDFDGPDRIRWQGQNCSLSRVGGASQAAAQGSRR